MREKGSRREAVTKAVIGDARASGEIREPATPADELFHPFFLPLSTNALEPKPTTANLKAAYLEARQLEILDHRRQRRGPRQISPEAACPLYDYIQTRADASM